MEIISRETWGARHDDGFGPAPLPVGEVYLHHSVTVAPDLLPPFDDDDAAVRTLEQIGEARFGRGISYTFVVTPVGRVYEGHGIARVGAHTRGRNSISRAVCLVGNYELAVPSPAMVTAVVKLLQYGHAQGWWTRARLTGGHRDAPGASTACPGRHAMAAIPEINRRAEALAVERRVLRTQAPMLAGDDVAGLQAGLRKWFPSYAGHLAVDGVYGPATAAVVSEFQVRSGLVGDGIVGPATWAALARYSI